MPFCLPYSDDTVFPVNDSSPQKVMIVYRGRYHIREALDLETLCAVLRGAGRSVRSAYDPDCFGATDNVFQLSPLARVLAKPGRIESQARMWQPDVLLFQVLSNTYGWCLAEAESLKERTGAVIVFMGLHPSLVPEHVMKHGCVDYVIAGEAENVVLDLLDALSENRDVGQVGSLFYRRDGEVLSTPKAPLVDLDGLPLPDKDLFRPYVSHRSSYCAMVSRGCPYSCSFCEETCSKKLYGGKYFRRKSVDTVMAELVEGKRRYRFREVIFKDSYLSGNKAWLEELMTRYRAEIGVPFKCFCTITGFDLETAQVLKEGGCYSIEFGLQTWNDDLRSRILNRRESSEEAIEAFRCCSEVRLRYDVDHMFNLPYETREDHVLGAEHYNGLDYLGRIKVHHLVYYPTADIVQHAVAAGDLPADAVECLAGGHESDFYDQATGNADQQRQVKAFAALYKILPLLPRRTVRWLASGRRIGWLRWIPSPVMAFLQGVNAMRCRDLRFAAYMRIYPRKVFHSLLGSETRSQ